MRADNAKKPDWTLERRAAQSELMRRVRPVDGKKPGKPYGGRVQKLTDEDLRLIHALARHREALRVEHQHLKERVAQVWAEIVSLSNDRIAEKFDVSGPAISHALNSTRGNRVV